MHQAKKKRVGKYLMLLSQQLGTGTFAQVYKAIDQNTHQQVAIKVIKKEKIQEDQYTKQAFIQQIKIMKLLKSKNIIRFLDVHQTMNNYYLVQQLANDGNFSQLLNQAPGRRFKQAHAITFMTQILNGFGQMVKNGIVHRDMKPANILLKNGIIKIADFGFAKQSDNSSFLKTILGTPLYMSPQLLKAQPYTYKCDIWALGVMFYEMLVGHTPWNWRNSEKKSWQYIKQTPIQFPPEFKISTQMKQLIHGCLGYEENQRYEWEQIYMSPIFADKFKQNFQGGKKTSIKSAFIISDIRMAIHSQNINMIKLIDQTVESDLVSFNDFARIFQKVDKELTPQKIKLLYEFCLFKISANQHTLKKDHLKEFLKINGIRIKADLLKSQQSDEANIRQTNPANSLLRRLQTNIQKQKKDIYQIYKAQDKSKKDALMINQFQILIKKIDPEINNHEITILFKQFDLNSDGKISFSEFQRTLCKIAGIPNLKN